MFQINFVEKIKNTNFMFNNFFDVEYICGFVMLGGL